MLYFVILFTNFKHRLDKINDTTYTVFWSLFSSFVYHFQQNDNDNNKYPIQQFLYKNDRINNTTFTTLQQCQYIQN
jgi:hypothetical protein